MQIKLLALDIDGTLLNSQHKLTPRTMESIRQVVAAGIPVALVTGRRFHAARPIARELGLQLPLITHNGVLTKDGETLEVINYHPLDEVFARELVKLGREYQADTLCCEDPAGEGFIVFEHITATNVRLRRYLDLYKEYAREVNDLYEHINGAPIQIFYCGSCSLMDRLADRLMQEMAGQARLTITTYPQADMTILDLINPDCSKATGLAALANRLNIEPGEIMAMGDNRNDLEMLHYVGLPVIMENAEASLKEYGFATTLSNDEDGVVAAIEKYIFS